MSVTIPTSDIVGLGTIATQAANNVSITGGSITGLTSLSATSSSLGAATASQLNNTPVGNVVPSTGSFTTVALNGIDAQSQLNQRGTSGGIAFHGITDERATATLTNQNIGTAPFSVSIKVLVPSGTEARPRGIVILSSSATGAAGNAFDIVIPNNATSITAQIFGPSLSDWIKLSVASFVTNYANQVVVLTFTRDGSGNVVFYINGIAQTTTVTTSGTSPGWGGSITSTYITLGTDYSGQEFNSNIVDASLYNRALTASDIAALVSSGGVPAQADRWGSQVLLNTSAWANGATPYGTFTSSTSDGFSATKTAGTQAFCISQAAFLCEVGKKISVRFSATINSGTAPIVFIGSQSTGALLSNTYTVVSGVNDLTFTISSTSATAVVVFYNNPGESSDFVISGANSRKIGVIAYYPCNELTGSTVYDATSNGNNMTLSGGAVLANPGPGTVPLPAITATTLTTSGNVGVGTTTPALENSVFITELTVAKTGAIAVATLNLQGNRTGLNDRYGTINAWNGSVNTARINFQRQDVDNSGRIVFLTAAAGTLAEAMMIDKSGNVSLASTTAATAVNTGALKGANFGFSGTLGDPCFVGGNLTLTNSAGPQLFLQRNDNTVGNYVTYKTATVEDWLVGSGASGANSDYEVYSRGTSAVAFKLARATGNATLAGSLAVGTNIGLGGTAADANHALIYAGATVSGTNCYGLVENGTFTLTGNGTEAASLYATNLIATTASNYSLTNHYGLKIGAASKSGGGTITNAYGAYIASPTIGGTNNYAIYTAGTAPSVFGGNLITSTGRVKHVKAVTATYTLDTTTVDEVVVANHATVPFTITLIDATAGSGLTNLGRYITIKNKGAAAVTIASATGSQIFTTSAQATVTLNTGDSADLVCDGVIWAIV